MVHDLTPAQSEENQEMSEVENIVKDCLISYSTNDIKALAENVKLLHDILHMYMDQESETTNYAQQNAAASRNSQE